MEAWSFASFWHDDVQKFNLNHDLIPPVLIALCDNLIEAAWSNDAPHENVAVTSTNTGSDYDEVRTKRFQWIGPDGLSYDENRYRNGQPTEMFFQQDVFGSLIVFDCLTGPVPVGETFADELRMRDYGTCDDLDHPNRIVIKLSYTSEHAQVSASLCFLAGNNGGTYRFGGSGGNVQTVEFSGQMGFSRHIVPDKKISIARERRRVASFLDPNIRLKTADANSLLFHGPNDPRASLRFEFYCGDLSLTVKHWVPENANLEKERFWGGSANEGNLDSAIQGFINRGYESGTTILCKSGSEKLVSVFIPLYCEAKMTSARDKILQSRITQRSIADMTRAWMSPWDTFPMSLFLEDIVSPHQPVPVKISWTRTSDRKRLNSYGHISPRTEIILCRARYDLCYVRLLNHIFGVCIPYPTIHRSLNSQIQCRMIDSENWKLETKTGVGRRKNLAISFSANDRIILHYKSYVHYCIYREWKAIVSMRDRMISSAQVADYSPSTQIVTYSSFKPCRENRSPNVLPFGLCSQEPMMISEFLVMFRLFGEYGRTIDFNWSEMEEGLGLDTVCEYRIHGGQTRLRETIMPRDSDISVESATIYDNGSRSVLDVKFIKVPINILINESGYPATAEQIILASNHNGMLRHQITTETTDCVVLNNVIYTPRGIRLREYENDNMDMSTIVHRIDSERIVQARVSERERHPLSVLHNIRNSVEGENVEKKNIIDQIQSTARRKYCRRNQSGWIFMKQIAEALNTQWNTGIAMPEPGEPFPIVRIGGEDPVPDPFFLPPCTGPSYYLSCNRGTIIPIPQSCRYERDLNVGSVMNEADEPVSERDPLQIQIDSARCRLSSMPSSAYSTYFQNNLVIVKELMDSIKRDRKIPEIENSSVCEGFRRGWETVGNETIRNYCTRLFEKTVDMERQPDTAYVRNLKRIVFSRHNAPVTRITTRYGRELYDCVMQNPHSVFGLREKLHVKYENSRGIDAGGLRAQFLTELCRQIRPLFTLIESTANGNDPRFYISNQDDGCIIDELNKQMKDRGIVDVKFKKTDSTISNLYVVAAQLFAACLINDLTCDIPLSRRLIRDMVCETIDDNYEDSEITLTDSVAEYLLECYRTDFDQGTLTFPQMFGHLDSEELLRESVESYIFSAYELSFAHRLRLWIFIGVFRSSVRDIIRDAGLRPNEVFYACCANPNFRSVDEFADFLSRHVEITPRSRKNDIIELYSNIARQWIADGKNMQEFMSLLLTWWTGTSVVQQGTKYEIRVQGRRERFSDDIFAGTSTCSQTIFVHDKNLDRWKSMPAGEAKTAFEKNFIDLSGNYSFTMI